MLSRKGKAGKPAKPRKPGLVERTKQHGREWADLGSTAINAPRELPSRLSAKMRRSLHTMYAARGGGLYAVGFVISFVILEVQSFFEGFQSSSGIGGLLGEQLLHLLLRFTLDSLGNTIQSLLWPLILINWSAIYGSILLVAGFFVFDRYIKKRLEVLLFGSDPQASPGESQS